MSLPVKLKVRKTPISRPSSSDPKRVTKENDEDDDIMPSFKKLKYSDEAFVSYSPSTPTRTTKMLKASPYNTSPSKTNVSTPIPSYTRSSFRSPLNTSGEAGEESEEESVDLEEEILEIQMKKYREARQQKDEMMKKFDEIRERQKNEEEKLKTERKQIDLIKSSERNKVTPV